MITGFGLTDEKIEDLGIVITVNTAIPCLLAAFCFYKSSAPYEEFLLSMRRNKEDAFEAAESVGF